MVVLTSANAVQARGEEGSEEERLKRQVAHGATASTDDVGLAAERPARSSHSEVKERRMTARVFELAWPIAATMLGETAMRIVDTKLAAGLGAAALAGVGLATVLMFACYRFSHGLMRGVNVRVAHAIGEGRPDDGFAYARVGLLLSATFGFVVLLLCRDVTPLLVALRTNPELVPYARDFLAAVTLSAPATCALVALTQHSQATGDSRTPMVIGISGNVVNALLAWSLIHGQFGLPAFGVRGAGYATAGTELVECALMLAIFFRKEGRARKVGLRSSLPFGDAFRQVVDLGVPTGVQFAVETFAFTAFNVVLGTISKEQYAAHQIALAILRVSFLPGWAVSEAVSVFVGRALGARRVDEANAAVRSGLLLTIGFMMGCGVIFALFGGTLGGLFTIDAAIVANVRTLLYVAAVFQLLDAMNLVFRGALTGAKDARAVMVIGVLVLWSFLPTSAYVLGKVCGLGALGGWLGFLGETAVCAALFGWRWKRLQRLRAANADAVAT